MYPSSICIMMKQMCVNWDCYLQKQKHTLWHTLTLCFTCGPDDENLSQNTHTPHTPLHIIRLSRCANFYLNLMSVEIKRFRTWIHRQLDEDKLPGCSVCLYVCMCLSMSLCPRVYSYNYNQLLCFGCLGSATKSL